MKPTIKPKNAATIWAVDTTIFVELPSYGLIHTVSVPATVEGLTKLLRLLAARTEQSKIGEVGEPTQHHINKPIDLAKVKRTKVKPKYSQEQTDSVKEVLRRLGMI